VLACSSVNLGLIREQSQGNVFKIGVTEIDYYIIIIHFPPFTAVQPVPKTVPVSLTKRLFSVVPKTS